MNDISVKLIQRYLVCSQCLFGPASHRLSTARTVHTVKTLTLGTYPYEDVQPVHRSNYLGAPLTVSPNLDKFSGCFNNFPSVDALIQHEVNLFRECLTGKTEKATLASELEVDGSRL